MRNVFLVLVLANLAFAAWQVWLSPRPEPHRPDALPGITLVSEVPSDLRTTGTAAEQPSAAPPAAASVTDARTATAEPAPSTAGGDHGGADNRAGAIAASGDAGPTRDATTAGANAASPPSSAAAPVPTTSGAPAAGAPSAAANGPTSTPPTGEGVATPANASLADASDSTAAAAAAAHCTSIGPFRELAQAATAAANLRASHYQPTQRVADGDVWIGYWVYIDAIPTETRANDILANVRAHGITDSYVIPNSDTGNLVSLGVFSEISGVVRRRDEVRALGYEPRVVDRTRRATVYWVDVLLAPEQTLDVESLQTPGRIVRLEQRPCPAQTG